MAFEQREGSGNLFTNDKRGSDKAPDRRGEIMLGGTVWELAGWIKDGKNGKFLSLSGKPKAAEASKPAQPKPQAADYFDDDIPF